ncbi:PREDICTED: LOW QUALITY PROTEIN: ATP-dependent zinc metalloprotease FTSH, chloroplastic-like [Erythranthe guttata]|uniref:LOW QUALITY PROTEIN: ATP-dependent zinc metalloprotease FTSH, chloroplastic-like n=1 Tax=Erythranthe guttata TaxID=4155 RepID=UPI00064D94F4|nr:PREDICTED: LOW QUALITY PROTEIN: ATP-dependent zinc metalloprotease FTSH, chloroplastic-like [Erythranthe guttata]|eukprot:XP_012829475.1 PREDICTED: LOW QUALITY PROTEIN: ATP-dependent zinc metalloprotease FTSH, chloroplastic-like [Erythranthe guttata]
MASSPLTTKPLLSSNFFGAQIFISPPTPKTTTLPRRFLLPQSILNRRIISDKSTKSNNNNITNHAALAALLFSSITPQAFALDNSPPPAPQVIEIEAQKAVQSSPVAQNLVLNAPKPQAQSNSDLPEGSQWRYSEFLNAVKKGKVERVRFSKEGSTLQLTAVDGRRAAVVVPNDPDLIDILAMNGVDISVSEGESENGLFSIIGNLFFPILAFAGLFFLFQRAQGGPGGGPGGLGGPMEFGRSKSKFQEVPETGVTFADVAGADQAKLELQEVVDFLKNPDKYTALGAKIPKGCLLVGPPGTGKTLLARAVSGEAGVPFFSCAASEFVELFVGVGASRVRDLFEKAKAKAPCIVFIDEIDAVGRQRGAGMGGGNDEREQTINQLLTEMDGFSGNSGVIVLAATNRPDVLDSALLRPGRFDRQVTVDRPDVAGRIKILQVHSRGKALAKDVDFEKIARRTPGFTGADLQNLMNEAAIFAARRDLKEISKDEISDALERIIAGPEKKNAVVSEEKKRLVAYHEAGHALVGALMPDYDPVAKMLVVNIWTGNVTTGASNDFMQVSRVARQMVERFGFSKKIGQIAIGGGGGNPFLGQQMSSQKDYSMATADVVDAEVRELVETAYGRAKELITTHIDILHKLAQLLLEKETVDGEEFMSLFIDGKAELFVS